MNTIYLSYYINENTPLYGGEKAINIIKRSEISKGASSNTKFLELPNHVGTHIDFPKHFSDEGKTINDYDPNFWKFNKTLVIDYRANIEEIIGSKLLKNLDTEPDVEFLIINTGFQQYRGQEIYWNNNPGLSPELAVPIKDKYPKIKAIGFDFISVSSYQNRLLGRKAHKEFLIQNDILLIEDMKLDQINGKNIKTIIALPWMIDQVDGVPISIIAEYE